MENNMLIDEFVKQLKYRLSLKAQTSSEETFLIKTFKYFDIQNRGELSFDQFARAVEKLGMQLIGTDDLRQIFQRFDKDSSGAVDYKEFSSQILKGRQTSYPAAPRSVYTDSQVTSSAQYSASTSPAKVNPFDLVNKFRALLNKRGIKGLIGLKKVFKAMDSNGNNFVNFAEFKKAIFDFRMSNEFTEPQLLAMFNSFDRNRDGKLSAEEFLSQLRGEMNDYRRDLVERVFIILDKSATGYVAIQDIKNEFNPKRHPEVQAGKKSADLVLLEFMETFDLHHQLYERARKDGKISQREFVDYYENLSGTIDDDEVFQVILNNTWNLSGGPLTSQSFAKSDMGDNYSMFNYMDSPDRPKHGTGLTAAKLDRAQPSHLKGFKQMTSADNPLVSDTASQYYTAQQQSKQQVRRQDPTWPRQDDVRSVAASQFSERSSASSVFHTEQIKLAKYQTILVARFLDQLQPRGIRGFVGLRRQFKIIDDGNNGSLTYQEFKEAIDGFELQVSPIDIKNAFQGFVNADNQIEYDEFVKVLVGPMNPMRIRTVEKAFDHLDINQNGIIDMDFIKANFDPKNHPDVRIGKRDPQDIRNEFIETFEMHHSIMHGYQAIDKISKFEFVEYYAHLSASITSDSQFLNVLNAVWNLDNKNNPSHQPFAGSKDKVLVVNSKQRYLHDHHRNMFGENNVPYGREDKQERWTTSSQSGRRF